MMYVCMHLGILDPITTFCMVTCILLMLANSILIILMYISNQHCNAPHGFGQVHAVILGLGCYSSVLEEHADDGHHGQSSVGQLC